MSRPRQPTKLVMLKGKKHFTKQEIQERLDSEIEVPNDNIVAPKFLTKKQKERFSELANTLKDIGIMSNLDCDLLGQYIVAYDFYEMYSKKLRIAIRNGHDHDTLLKAQDRYYKQSLLCAKELGLTISSRCKIQVPKQKNTPMKENKFDKFNRSG